VRWGGGGGVGIGTTYDDRRKAWASSVLFLLRLVHTEELLLHLVHLEVGLPQRRELPVVIVVRYHPTEHFYFYGMFKDYP
jgi:hypothetical protein